MTFGLVAEGPTDCNIIENIINMFYPDSTFRYLQPDLNAISRTTYNGCDGVWEWCLKSSELMKEFNKVPSHSIDFLIIHLDGDTTRSKKIHCNNSANCAQGKVCSPVYCRTEPSDCPIVFDDTFIKLDISQKSKFLKDQILSWIDPALKDKVILCLPFDSPESWIVAAFDKNTLGNPELIEKPADTVIAHSKYYHKYPVKRHDGGKLKKSVKLYNDFLIPKLCEQWENVKSLCSTAQTFETDLKKTIGP